MGVFGESGGAFDNFDFLSVVALELSIENVFERIFNHAVFFFRCHCVFLLHIKYKNIKFARDRQNMKAKLVDIAKFVRLFKELLFAEWAER